jgi:hypothetical protein
MIDQQSTYKLDISGSLYNKNKKIEHTFNKIYYVSTDGIVIKSINDPYTDLVCTDILHKSMPTNAFIGDGDIASKLDCEDGSSVVFKWNLYLDNNTTYYQEIFESYDDQTNKISTETNNYQIDNNNILKTQSINIKYYDNNSTLSIKQMPLYNNN